MKNKLLILILALVLTGTNSMAQEVIRGFDAKEDLPYLNKILRRSARRLNAIENGVSLTSGVTGILPLLNGGTGSALVDPDADRIGFWDDSEGTFDWLTPGTGLVITGTTMDVSGVGMGTLVSATSFSGATVTGNITLETEKIYKLIFETTIDGATNSAITMQFNDVASGHTYSAVGGGAADTNQASVPLGTMYSQNPDVEGIIFEMTIHTKDRDDQACIFTGEYSYFKAAAVFEHINFGGAFIGSSGVIASIEFTSAQNMSGNVYLYEMRIN